MLVITREASSISERPLLDEVLARVERDGAESILWLVPTEARARAIEATLVRATEGQALSQSPVQTVNRFAGTLLSVTNSKVRVLTDAESGVFLEQAIHELLAEGALTYFEAKRTTSSTRSFPLPQGTFEMVLNTIRQLKEHGIYVPELQREVVAALATTGERTHVRRSRDILTIFERYEQLLRPGFTDTYGQLEHLNARYTESPVRSQDEVLRLLLTDLRSCYPHAQTIYVDQFYRIERPALQLLTTLSQVAEIEVQFRFSEPEANPTLFASIGRTVSHLTTAGIDTITRIPDQSESPILERLRTTLFLESEDEPVDAVDAITIVSCRSKVEEAEDVATVVKHLVHTDSDVAQDLSRICITYASGLDYTELFRDTFKRFDIPVNITDRYKLEGSPIMNGVLALLEVAAHGLHRRDVLRALTSPYFVFASKTGERIDPANMLEVLADCKITGDVDSWRDHLRQHVRALERKQLECEAAQDDYELRSVQARLARANKALADITALIEMLAPFRAELKPWQFKHHLHELFSRLKFGDQLLAHNQATIAMGTLELDTRSYRAFIKLLEDLDALYSLMGVHDTALPVHFYLERLRTASLWTRYNPRYRSGHVHVASLEQIQGLEFDYVFLVGLTEGVLPAAYEPQIFLMESTERDAMQHGEEQQLAEERMLFFSALAAARKHCYLTYPRASASGAELQPSEFLASLRRCVRTAEGLSPGLTTSISCYEALFERAGSALKIGAAEELRAALLNAEVTLSESPTDTLLEFAPVSTEMQAGRTMPDPTRYRGYVDLERLTADERAYLAQLKSRPWSITQLERYALCPFSFFVDTVMGLQRTADVEEGLDAREQGTFLHGVLREFFTERRERGETHVQDLEDLTPAIEEARGIAERHLQSMDARHPFWQLDTERVLGRKGEDGVLDRFIRKEQTLGEYKPRPQFFEVSFGHPGGSNRETDSTLQREAPIDLGGIYLRGKIDRIDVSDTSFTVIDYKSGTKTRKRKDIERGISLQLPLYLRVTEELLRQHLPELKGVAALYHKVMDAKSNRELGLAVKEYMKSEFESFHARNSGLVQDLAELESLIEATVERARTYVEGISSGKFELTAKDLTKESCTYCPYSHACRVKEAVDYDVLVEPAQITKVPATTRDHETSHPYLGL